MALLSDFEVRLDDETGLSRLSREHGNAPLPARAVMRLLKACNARCRRTNGTVNRRFADLLEVKAPPNEIPSKGVFTRDIVVEAGTGVWARFFFPAAAPLQNLLPVVFYFHGGGFCFLTADTVSYDTFCRRLCRRTAAVIVSVNYRRSPEHRCPVPYHDCLAAVKWVQGLSGSKEQREMVPYELDVGRCVLMGDSAGANIAHHVGCMLAKEEHGGGTAKVRIAAHVLLFPFFGGEERTAAEIRLADAPLVSPENAAWCWRSFLPPGESRNHWACNVVRGEAGKQLASLRLPETLVVVGELDGLKDWQVGYAKSLSEMGKKVRMLFYPGGVHAFHVLDRFKHSSILLSHLASYLHPLLLPAAAAGPE